MVADLASQSVTSFYVVLCLARSGKLIKFEYLHNRFPEWISNIKKTLLYI